ncbi:MAG TPA: cyclic pyranopterin monophosphate synthase MoaC [Calditrichia bacterium]|nr:cyclic pyranopterin monophosphate synthase MoaC [Calditrichota bacterium]HQU73239.1 cyclic pyranopterin monophosphate synthase MoaC [Calditrichia bacterium]HQV30739.1 cyclic pyranopterin monophosphate synthase MoaC [Calditrichia bacterium]
MIDVSHKSNTLRYARAEGLLTATAGIIERVRQGTVPKGDVLAVARAMGISAGKRCADWMVFCHNIPLDWIDLRFEVGDTRITVIAEARTLWKTGVEMEVLTAVSNALLNMYDMLKPLTDELEIGPIRVVEKRGGKSDPAS